MALHQFAEWVRSIPLEVLASGTAAIIGAVSSFASRPFDPRATVAAVIAGPFLSIPTRDALDYYAPWLTDTGAALLGGALAGACGLAFLRVSQKWLVKKADQDPPIGI